ncbi:unnamed protein product, partial [Porites lobata]
MKDDVERVILLTNVAVNIPLALTSVIGNSMVLHAIRKTPSLRSPLTFLICGLALSDLAVVSLCTIACISIDRLIAVQKPLRYPSIVTKYRISR